MVAGAAGYFITHCAMYGLDLSGKNGEGNTVRNIALLNSHHALAHQLLTAETDNYLRALRLWQEMGLNHA